MTDTLANTLLNILVEDTSFIVFVAMITLIPLIIEFCDSVVVPFLDERAYLKMEINRSGDEDEARYYKKKLKRLYLQHIPFIGLFFK